MSAYTNPLPQTFEGEVVKRIQLLEEERAQGTTIKAIVEHSDELIPEILLMAEKTDACCQCPDSLSALPIDVCRDSPATLAGIRRHSPCHHAEREAQRGP
jgi:hypothetical protein